MDWRSASAWHGVLYIVMSGSSAFFFYVFPFSSSYWTRKARRFSPVSQLRRQKIAFRCHGVA